ERTGITFADPLGRAPAPAGAVHRSHIEDALGPSLIVSSGADSRALDLRNRGCERRSLSYREPRPPERLLDLHSRSIGEDALTQSRSHGERVPGSGLAAPEQLRCDGCSYDPK